MCVVLYEMKTVLRSHHLPISSVPMDLFQSTQQFATELVSLKHHNLQNFPLFSKNDIFLSQTQDCDGPQKQNSHKLNNLLSCSATRFRMETLIFVRKDSQPARKLPEDRDLQTLAFKGTKMPL